MSNSDAWYIVKQENGQCAVLPAAEVEGEQVEQGNKSEQWGPYASQQEAIARRVGLIRSGKCQPA